MNETQNQNEAPGQTPGETQNETNSGSAGSTRKVRSSSQSPSQSPPEQALESESPWARILRAVCSVVETGKALKAIHDAKAQRLARILHCHDPKLD